MLIERTNLHNKLLGLRKKEQNESELLEEVKRILNAEKNLEQEIIQRIYTDRHDEFDGNSFNFDLLETNRIFHKAHIKELCVAYRLRFLSTQFFKGDLPLEAITAVKNLEWAHQTSLIGFKMVAPAPYFRLENADDPMLFAPLGNDYYYLVHKWGTDMHPLRKLAMWPLKNFENLVIFTLLFSFILSFGIREVFFSRYQETAQFFIIFLYTFQSVFGLGLFFGISLGKNFSSENWNSKFYNA